MVKSKLNLKPFTESHEKTYNQLYNYLLKNNTFNNIDKDIFIMEHKRQLMSLIEKSDYSDSSKKSLFFMIARWLLNNGEKRYNKIYSQLGYDLKQKIETLEGNNELDKREIESVRPYKYFVDILDNINYDEITTQKEHYKYLLLSMLILQAPVRTSFYSSAQFIRKLDENNKKDNFILINRRGKVKVSYIINNDKASGYKNYTINKELSTIPILNEQLAIIINDSFIKYPRSYLFENIDNDNKAISDATLLSYLRSVVNIPGININMMRSIYITEKYKTLNYGEKQKLANQMRHSVQTASINYDKKINAQLPDNETIELLNKKLVNLELDITNLKLKLTTYENSEPNVKKYNKNRNDILYLLNTKGNDVKASTILKYDIIKDTNGIYK